MPIENVYIKEGVGMLRVAVSGAYGFNKTGDEAILLTLIATLKTLSPGIKITVYSHRPQETKKVFGVNAINRWNIFAIIHNLMRSDMLFSGGLLQDTGGVGSICYYLTVVSLAKLLGRQVIYYAHGLGSVRSRFGRWLTRVVSNRVDLITVCDEASRDDYLALRVKRPAIVLTADPVLALSPAQFDLKIGAELLERLSSCGSPGGQGETEITPIRTEAASGSAPVRKNRLGLVLRDWKVDSSYQRAVAQTADRMSSEGWEVVVIPYHYPKDLSCCQEVASFMKECNILVSERIPLETMFSLLGNLDLVLGMSLHALIMASVMRTPCVGLPYDKNVQRFLELTNQPAGGSADHVESDFLYQTLMKTWDERQEIATRLDQVLIQLRQQAWETASLSLSVFYSRSPNRRGEIERNAYVRRRNESK
jgi:polysaccharide pyruvyl transferase CsaB